MITERYSIYNLEFGARPRVLFTYYVTGRGEFPFHMLRYDSCWPGSGEDALKLPKPETREGYGSLRCVQMCSYREPTVDRWSSFLWSVSAKPVENKQDAKA